MRIRFFILFVCIYMGASAQGNKSFWWSSVVPATFVADSALFNFSATTRTITLSTNVVGDPFTGVRSATAGNGWSVSSISTNNWKRQYGSSCAAQNISGSSTANTYFTELTNAAFQDCWYLYTQFANNYHVDTPHLRISNLNPLFEYEIRASWTRASLSAFDANPCFMYAKGATTVGPSSGLNASVAPQGSGYVDSGTSQPIKLYPNGSGQIDLYFTTSTTADFTGVSILKVKRTL